MDVQKATATDLAEILAWLEDEYQTDGSGFWTNRRIISKSLEDGDLWIIRKGGKAVAFQVGNYAAEIACVQQRFQRKGLGSELYSASLERAINNDVNVLKGECSPSDSLPFWQSKGFKRYGNTSHQILVRKIIERSLKVPVEASNTTVVIKVFSEDALYSDGVELTAVHYVRGGRTTDGLVHLERRIIALNSEVPAGKDVAIDIQVAGKSLCFCKAKRPEAQSFGVHRDRIGDTYFIDAIQPVSSGRS